MLNIAAMLLVLGVVAWLLCAASRPDAFAVERSTSVAAPADTLFPPINNLRQFNRWNPCAREDPATLAEYSGSAAGPGAVLNFQGNEDVGKGRISIIDATKPSPVAMQLDMWEPFEGHNEVHFLLVPEGLGTRVAWAMHGPSAFIPKLMGLFFDLDPMIGQDFEVGLADLKALAEQP